MDYFAGKYRSLYTSAPTECSELDIIKWQINEVCDEQTLDSCRVTPVDVKHAISKLKKGKKRWSRLLYVRSPYQCGSDMPYVILAMLCNSMLSHWYNLNQLLLSVIMSIPKDIRNSLSSGDNYRGMYG